MLKNRLFSIKGLWTHKTHRASSMIQDTFLDYRFGVCACYCTGEKMFTDLLGWCSQELRLLSIDEAKLLHGIECGCGFRSLGFRV